MTIPSELHKQFPEKFRDGFFWVRVEDFHYYFDTVFECRLVNSPDVGIEGMPLPRFAVAPIMPPPMLPGMPPLPAVRPRFFEWVFANSGVISQRNLPEINVMVPAMPCEIVVSVEQTDARITQIGRTRKPYVPIMLKVYQLVMGNVFSKELVCKSNWLPTRDAMVAFRCERGGMFKITVEIPDFGVSINRMVCRCYASVPTVNFSMGVRMFHPEFVVPQDPPLGLRWTLVGGVNRERLARDDLPEPLGEDLDSLRRRHEGHQRCVVM